MLCKCAIYDSVEDRYVCNLNDEECMLKDPDSVVCAEQYGIGSDTNMPTQNI